MLIHCSKNHLLIFVLRQKTRLISTTTSTQLTLMCCSYRWCKSKHAQTCPYNYQVTWFFL